ncbi:MAG: acetyl-CoA carboxylase biotin carboxyl carrier protein subunit [Chitinophagales bacterium]|nr:acetyl-CoA carboxylase biotin carboxyl carrier protein subunit [Chitinophagales bacterium]
MLKIKVNNQEFSLNNQSGWDIIGEKDMFHILKDNKSYRCIVLKKDEAAKNMLIEVNGNTYTINIKDKYDVLLEQLGMSNMTTKKMKDIKAPMPGLVLDIKVSNGSTIEEGDAILVLEAMKMENVLKSPGSGIIKNIKVKKGDAVEKGQVLIEVE